MAIINEINGGKGMTRREIAQKAVDRLRGELEAALVRLDKAIADEAGRVGKSAKKAESARKRAISGLMGLGKTEEEAIALVDGPVAKVILRKGKGKAEEVNA